MENSFPTKPDMTNGEKKKLGGECGKASELGKQESSPAPQSCSANSLGEMTLMMDTNHDGHS